MFAPRKPPAWAFREQGKYESALAWQNQFRPETREAITRVIERMRRDDKIQSVILAGTELPLLLRNAEPEGITFLDTTMIHVRAAVEAICA